MTDSAQSAWSPELYARFRDERSRPFFDLLTLVRPRPGMRVIDLGCGSGELTHALHRQLQARETIGLDSSETMLAHSGAFAGGGLRFVRGDIAAFAGAAASVRDQPDVAGARPGGAPDGGADRELAQAVQGGVGGDPVSEPDGVTGGGDRDAGATTGGVYDLIFSNAALQWVPGHEALLVGLTRRLAAGGQLAVQVPANHDHPSHVAAAAVAGEPPFDEALGDYQGFARRTTVLAPEVYATLLDRLGYREQHVRLQVYAHHLAGRDDVVEWVKGTLLTDFRRRLPAALYDRLLERYRERLLPQLDDTHPFFYPFKRLLLWAQR